MLLGNSRKGLLIFLPLLVASVVSAAPIATDNSRNFTTPALSASADAYLISYEINQTNKFYNPRLARVAAEIFKPPAITNLYSSNTSVKSLPAVPGTLFMVLAGFLCVSLVNDRRAWLAVLAGLLWLGQTGFAALPQLASHLLSKKQIQQSVAGGQNLIYVSELDGSYRLRSDLEGTQYIGLLRHLAGIPAPPTSLPLPVFPLSLRGHLRWPWQSQLPKEPRLLRCPPLFHSGGLLAMTPDPTSMSLRADSSPLRVTSSSLRAKRSNLIDRLPQSAILPPALRLIPANFCSVPKTGQTVPFSPAFIFSRLARSPPQQV
jgi:hypothetical protein